MFDIFKKFASSKNHFQTFSKIFMSRPIHVPFIYPWTNFGRVFFTTLLTTPFTQKPKPPQKHVGAQVLLTGEEQSLCLLLHTNSRYLSPFTTSRAVDFSQKTGKRRFPILRSSYFTDELSTTYATTISLLTAGLI